MEKCLAYDKIVLVKNGIVEVEDAERGPASSSPDRVDGSSIQWLRRYYHTLSRQNVRFRPPFHHHTNAESHRTQMLPSKEAIQRLRPLALEALRARAQGRRPITTSGGAGVAAAATTAGASSLVPQVGEGGNIRIYKADGSKRGYRMLVGVADRF